jgi:disulfide bond formation protein DsbB
MWRLILTPILRTHRGALLLAGLSCLALTGGGLVFSHVLNLAACSLCVIQRMLYLLMASFCFLGLFSPWNIGARLGAGWAAVAGGAGMVASGYQTWIQRVAPETVCGAHMPWWEELAYDASDKWPFLFRISGLCSDPAWKFLGLSIAEWSLLCFSVLTVLLLSLAFKARFARPRGLFYRHE